jgi:hypothetical protein
MAGPEVAVLAHAFGTRYELPLPLSLFVLGGALVVAASFLLTLRADRPEIPRSEAPDVVPPARGSRWGTAAGLVLLLFVAVVGITGRQGTSDNIAPLAFWVLFWIVVPLTCGVFGDWTRSWNPFGQLARLGDSTRLRKALIARERPLAWPPGLGWWPAVMAFVLLVLGELVFQVEATRPAFIGTALLIYAMVCFTAGLLVGPAWQARGEVFSALFDVWGRLGLFRHGAPGRKGFAGGLDVPFERSASRVVFVALMLVSINFDGLLSTPQWVSYEREALGTDVTGVQGLRTASLGVLVLVVLAVFAGFAAWSSRAGRLGLRPIAALAELLPSLVPIAFGYLVAHYTEYLVTNGQLLAPLLGNPGYDSWPFAFFEDFDVNRTALPTSVYWYVSLVAIVAVHVVAVFLASGRLNSLAPDRAAARRADYPWLVAMIAYTAFSLFLVAQPLVQPAEPEALRSVPPAGFEPALLPPEGSTLSPELRGLGRLRG